MGLFWDLVQHSQISDQRSRADSLEDRVSQLEAELADTRATVHQLLQRLETHVGADLDKDGSVG